MALGAGAGPAAAGEQTIRIIESPQVSQPAPFPKGGTTVVVPRTRIEIDEGAAKPVLDLTGKARVVDGDEMEIDGQRIRLHGIDAPDLDQTCTGRKGDVAHCGRLAAQALTRLLGGQAVTCKAVARDEKGRLLATCTFGPFSINEQMVLDGWALADPKDGEPYRRAQAFAEARKEGLWRLTFTAPWEWWTGRAKSGSPAGGAE